MSRRGWVYLASLVVSALALVVVVGSVRISPDVAALLPDRGEGEALGAWARAFGGADPAVVLVRAEDAAAVSRAAQAATDALARSPEVRRVFGRITVAPPADPTLAWRLADAGAQQRLATALDPEGMRARLAGTRALLLAPGAAAAVEVLQRDPLRLSQIPLEAGTELLAGARSRSDGELATEDGRARLLVVEPRGHALRGKEARAFVDAVEATLGSVRRASPGVTLELGGGHAIAAATESMIRADLARSGALSLVLASLVFALTFRRVRALAALLPPLALGTLLTASLAALVPGGLSAIAIAFAAVVVGVGVDTGVHVYEALLEARRQGASPDEAARLARSRTARPVLVAAAAAGLAFASLGLSQISALRQLGLLCGAGELLTALAILAVLPEIGARLERGAPPAAVVPAPIRLADRLSATPRRALVALLALAVPALAFGLTRPAQVGGAMVAVRPAGLAPLDLQRELYRLFGGREGQWVVTVQERDPEAAMLRGDRLTEAIGSSGAAEGLDSLSTFLPSQATQLERLRARDRLDLPARAAVLERSLGEQGFDPTQFRGALEQLRNPSHAVVLADAVAEGPIATIAARHLARAGADTLLAIYVRPRPGAEARLEQAIFAADPGASITGWARLEATLKRSLLADLPKVSATAAALVLVTLFASLRRAREVALAALVVVVELGAVLALARVLGIRLHVYDALVLPALLGITVDEAVFLLERIRADGVARALAAEGPAITATALTTSAGFAALLACRFEPLRDLGALGAMGSALGLVAALVIVPAGMSLPARRLTPP